MADVMSSPFYDELWTPDVTVGDEAPELDLRRLGSAERVRLADLRGRLVAIAFGSYT
jgi:hypothetical protein